MATPPRRGRDGRSWFQARTTRRSQPNRGATTTRSFEKMDGGSSRSGSRRTTFRRAGRRRPNKSIQFEIAGAEVRAEGVPAFAAALEAVRDELAARFAE